MEEAPSPRLILPVRSAGRAHLEEARPGLPVLPSRQPGSTNQQQFRRIVDSGTENRTYSDKSNVKRGILSVQAPWKTAYRRVRSRAAPHGGEARRGSSGTARHARHGTAAAARHGPSLAWACVSAS
jgi:hypothetical protein